MCSTVRRRPSSHLIGDPPPLVDWCSVIGIGWRVIDLGLVTVERWVVVVMVD